MSTNYPGSLDSYSTKVDGVDTVLASHINNPQDAIVAIETELGTDPAGSYTDVKDRLEAIDTDAWTNWTPAIDQSGSVACTVNLAKYRKIGKVCFLEVKLTATAAGGGAAAIIISGLPAAVQVTQANAYIVIGTGVIVDGGTVYTVSVIGRLADGIRFYGYNVADYFGAAPAITLANGDVIAFSATYEIA